MLFEIIALLPPPVEKHFYTLCIQLVISLIKSFNQQAMLKLAYNSIWIQSIGIFNIVLKKKLIYVVLQKENAS